MHFHDIILILFAFLSEFIGTLSGFGSSIFFVPLAVLVESFHFVLAITAILHRCGNFSRIFTFKDSFQKGIFLRLALPSIVLTVLGALLATQVKTPLLENGLGVVLIFLSVVLLFGKKLIQLLPSRVAVVLCGVSGFLTGLVGTGGAIRGIALTALNVEKNAFVCLSASIDIEGDFFRMIIYLRNGFVDWSQWFYIPLLGIAAILGSKFVKGIMNQIKQEQFDRIVSFFIFLSGIVLVLEN